MVALGNGNGSVIVDAPRNAVDLLAEFKLTGRQEAFEEIVRRYAAMVFGVCLKTTRNAHDAEDATQAVFLSLATHCKTNGQAITYVGPWLQKVARRVSLDIRRSKKRRQAREETHATTNGHGNDNGRVEGGQEGVDVEELKEILNEELHQLPAKYRLPMILHYYGGLSREEMAKELGCKPSTLGVRIHRGRQMLAERLSVRGASLGNLSLGFALTLSVRGAVSDGIIASTSKAAAELMAGNQLGSMISAHVLAFSHGAAGMAMIAKLKTAAAVVVVAALTLTGAAGALAKVVPLDELKLQWQLKIQGLFKVPRLQSPFRSPLAAGDSGDSGAVLLAARSAAADAAVHTVLWLAEGPAAGGDRPRVRPNAQPNRGRRGVGAAGRVVTQLVSTVIHAGASPGPRGTAGVSADPPPAPGWPMTPAAPVAVASAAPLPRPLPPHRAHRLAPARGSPGPGIGAVAVTGSFAGGAARAEGSVTLGHGRAMYPLVPPARMMPSGTAPPPAARGPVLARGTSMTVGGAPGTRGKVTIARDALAVDNQVIGEHGDGELTHSGGDNIAHAVRIGVESGGKGTYNLNGDRLFITPDGTAAAPGTRSGTTPGIVSGLAPQLGGIQVGREGVGELNIGDPSGVGEISDTASYGTIGGSLVVGGGAAGSGLLRGSGVVRMGGFFDHNGRVVADGYGHDRTLEFGGFRYVGNSVDNPAADGASGWFARDHGRLVLPNLRVRKGSGTYTWGDDPSDPTIDLVNSARVTIHDAARDGLVRLSLLSTDHGDVPALPAGHTFIGVWQFESDGLGHGAVDLLVRYDDALAADMRLDENALKLWRYADGQWVRINDASFTRDVHLNLIGGRADTLEFFAISAPEPGAAALLLGGGVLLLRRRRRDR